MKTRTSDRLFQLQCGREGTLFYYQTANTRPSFDWRCPLCGSKRVTLTGRTFKPVNENAPLATAGR